jgi:hypothetical protein
LESYTESMKRALRVLLAAAGSVLVTGAGYAALILGVHSPGPAQKIFQAVALPVLSAGITYDWLGNAFFAWLAVALGAVLWFGLMYAGLGVFPRRRT